MTTLIEMQDDVNISLMHEPVHAWAGYVGGLFPTEHPLFEKYPNLPHVGICVNAEEDGDVLDLEAGDARPDQFPGWFRRQKARGVKRPKAYASKSEMPAVMAAARADGIQDDEYDRWVASFDGRPLLDCGLGEKAKQYTDHGYARSLDLSVVDPSFFPQTVIPVVNKIDYSKFDKTKRRVLLKQRSEYEQVQLYDRLRAMQTPKLHPRRAQLAFVRRVMYWFAKRLDEVAITNEPLKNGKPSWSVDNRGWRRKQLWLRFQGGRAA
jgi:hypothetical protein